MTLWGNQIILEEADWENGKAPVYTVREYIVFETMAVAVDTNHHLFGYGENGKSPATMRLYIDCTNGVATADVVAYERSLGL